ncbi:MAG: hypothetical protein EOP86_18630 [Verrucomicrobiaceae bacterium]|nr:MAG: hypothetical protein EOP86_18630 [Verrucomicrobiaceae bacterium]
MKPEPVSPIPIASPCPKSWDGMDGDDKKRFCTECRLHVHNLSALDTKERAEVLSQPADRICIAYELRPDGGMVTPSRWSRLPFHRMGLSVAAALAAAFPMFFSACAPSRKMSLGEAPAVPASESKNPTATLGVFVPEKADRFTKGKRLRETPPMMMGAPPADWTPPDSKKQ